MPKEYAFKQVSFTIMTVPKKVGEKLLRNKEKQLKILRKEMNKQLFIQETIK